MIKGDRALVNSYLRERLTKGKKIDLVGYWYKDNNTFKADNIYLHQQGEQPVAPKPQAESLEEVAPPGPLQPTFTPLEPAKTRFTKAKDGVISDSATGLEWYVGPDQDTTWNQAKSWTESLTVAGGGWRMPTVPELKTLFQPGAGLNNMDPIFQPTDYCVWSGAGARCLVGLGLRLPSLARRPGITGYASHVRAFAVRSRR